jgi:hypothetical protein
MLFLLNILKYRISKFTVNYYSFELYFNGVNLVKKSDRKFMMPALNHSKIRPSKIHDSETQSAIDPINPLVYIQARYRHLKTGLGWTEIIQYIVGGG